MFRRTSLRRLFLTVVFFSSVFWLAAQFLGSSKECTGEFCSDDSSYNAKAWHKKMKELNRGASVESFYRPVAKTGECAAFEGIDDILVIFKTGATESLKKLPAHFNTTMRCLTNYVIYSDMAEEIEGHQVLDSLDDVDPHIKQTYPGFEMYNRLSTQGRDGLLPHESTEGKGGAAWNLDKWKFLPIVDKVWRNSPKSKFYVYVEADTYVFWPNMIKWLSHFDSTQPYYIGNQMQIGEQVFGHGGAGFVMSNEAMRRAYKRHQENLKFYDEFTAAHWAGDCVLGKMMQDEGINLLWAWPLLQEHKASQLDPTSFGWDKRLWCYPAVTYHHVNAEEVEGFYEFERDWLSKGLPTVRFKDVFEHYLRPKFQAEIDAWDNMSADTEYSDARFQADPKVVDGLSQAERDAPGSFQRCRLACEGQNNCVQYSYALDEHKCMLGQSLKLGNANTTYPGGIKSGFLMNRIDKMVELIEPCKTGGWILPP